MNYLKGLNRTRIQAATVEDYLLCKFHGLSFAKWDPLPYAEKWFLAGKRQKRDILHRVAGTKAKRGHRVQKCCCCLLPLQWRRGLVRGPPKCPFSPLLTRLQACPNRCPATWSNEKKNAVFCFFLFPPPPPVFPLFPGIFRCFFLFFDCFCACAIFSGIH